ncbi:MAG: hypothetical protein J5787_09765 [Alphaproteobacteria bacterium]|nr:hypothetical protein [Alphaproteobacteria bacterium]
MYDIDRPKFVFITLLEDFIRETEHSLAYFFALLVFLLTFLLTLFGKEALYTGLIGVLCLFLIKLRDIIESFRELPLYISKEKTIKRLKESENLCACFDDAALTAMSEEFPRKFNRKEKALVLEKSRLLSYLNTYWKIIETLCVFFPDQPLRPETRQTIKKMASAAQKYLLSYLEKKYALTTEQTERIENDCFSENIDELLLQTRLEAAGIDETTAQWSVKAVELLRKIRKYANFEPNSPAQQTDSIAQKQA